MCEAHESRHVFYRSRRLIFLRFVFNYVLIRTSINADQKTILLKMILSYGIYKVFVNTNVSHHFFSFYVLFYYGYKTYDTFSLTFSKLKLMFAIYLKLLLLHNLAGKGWGIYCLVSYNYHKTKDVKRRRRRSLIKMENANVFVLLSQQLNAMRNADLFSTTNYHNYPCIW